MVNFIICIITISIVIFSSIKYDSFLVDYRTTKDKIIALSELTDDKIVIDYIAGTKDINKQLHKYQKQEEKMGAWNIIPKSVLDIEPLKAKIE